MNKTGKIPCPGGASVLGQELAVDSSDSCFLHNLKAKDTLFKDWGQYWASLGNPPATQETQIQSPVREDPTCRRAIKPVHHNC